MQQTTKPNASGVGCLVLIGVVLLMWLWSAVSPKSEWVEAVGHLYPNVKLYTGNLPEPTLIGTITDLTEDERGQRVVGVLWPNGTKTWIPRDQIIYSEKAYWIRRDDPALPGR